ncbi:uncharacterized protein BX663DRAFT_434568 [Cokeromyces recurvatus]|uniref:uncharacterized protein n=1 Tax=Cokeromyces recurvatus TaxID=90255 RepID=UPI00221EAFE5|nr:uncharacterized protein BX663DRAFT_434568 [Cokeromyces recurvatus]KAI7903114.1 hypothetical protein BX663DRAFT_434568 [Cokeromyces recurvatus]
MDDVFLQRLYCAFGGDEQQSIDFSKFVDGLSIFMRGTPEEKLRLSFKLYDVDKDGFISKEELEHVMLQLVKKKNKQNEIEEIQRAIDCMFEDFDVDCDGKLSFEEYKLSAMKEPLIADFVERFLDLHNLSNNPKPSRPTSVRSRQSSRSINATQQQNRLSYRLSQAELLDYSHQQQQQKLNSLSSSDGNTTTTAASIYSPLIPSGSLSHSNGANTTTSNSSSSSPSLSKKHNSPYRLSRGTSMTSLDAAMTSM